MERPQKKSVPGILKEEGDPGSCNGVKWGKVVGDEVGGLAGGWGGGGDHIGHLAGNCIFILSENPWWILS